MIWALKLGAVGLGRAFLMAFVSTLAWGQAPNFPVAPFQNLNVLTRIKGSIVCVDCSLEEVQREQAASGQLYELHTRRGEAVLRVDDVDDAARWASVTMGR